MVIRQIIIVGGLERAQRTLVLAAERYPHAGRARTQSGCHMSLFDGIGALLYCLYSRAFDELEAWRNPPTPRLSNIEHDVVMTVAAFWDNERSPDERDIRLHLNLTPIAVHAALDGLVSWQLIEPAGNRWDGFAIGLTPKGRAYVQHPDSLARRNRKLG